VPVELYEMTIARLRSELPTVLMRLERMALRQNAEWAAAARWPALSFVPSAKKCRQILYLTKCNGLIGIRLDADRLTSRATIFTRYGLVTPVFAKRVFAEARASAVPVDFVGDLDPHDLTVYLTLACAERGGFARVRYLGVADQW
jgi:hypothetical protein